MKLKTLLFGSVSFVFLWFLGWEAWGIWDAREKTATIFAPYRSASTGGWDRLRPDQQEMLLAVVDPGFFGHRGLDMRTPGGGGQTVTQILADHLYVARVTPGFFRLESGLISFFVIDPLVAKEVQLNAFLTVVDMGTRSDVVVTGFQDAARIYFRAPLRDLSPEQFARLVAMVRDPVLFAMSSDANWERTDRIMALTEGRCAPNGPRDYLFEAC